jgi:hypothetical protein
MDNPFSADYGEARAKFSSAARAAGAELEIFPHAQRGPDGGELATDVAWLAGRCRTGSAKDWRQHEPVSPDCTTNSGMIDLPGKISR